MTDQNSVKAEESAVEPETTQVDSPTTEEHITNVQTEVKVSDDQGTVTEESVDLPEDVEKQRRAFQEQRQEIKRLKSEIQNRTRGESAFSAFKQQTPPVGQVNAVNIQDFQDPVTGETNWQAYNQQINVNLNQIRQSAAHEAQQAVREELDEQNARNRHPELFSDPEVEQEIADRWFAAKMRGENPTISDIADRVSKRFSKTISKAEKIGAEKILNEVSEKETAGLTVSAQSAQPARQTASAEKMRELSEKTRMGDNEALAARMSQIPWANK
jgi:hypothetical protein